MAVVLTWNVQGRVRGIVEQATALAGRRCDVVALQEVRATALAGVGGGARAPRLPPCRRHAAARRRATRARAPPRRRHRQQDADRDAPGGRGPVAERYLVARTRLDGEVVEVHNVHAPISQKADAVKVRTLEAVHGALATGSDVPRVLVGDLDAPLQSREGEVQSFARARAGTSARRTASATPARAPARHRPRGHGYVDASRDLHGYTRATAAGCIPTAAGYRLDHVIVRIWRRRPASTSARRATPGSAITRRCRRI